MGADRYLTVVVFLTLALIGTIAAVNASLDPYGLRQAATPSGGMPRDVGERPGEFWRKAFSVRSAMPRTVILGTSRAGSSLDVLHPGFSSEDAPVLNLALGAAQIEQQRLLLIHAHSLSGLRKAVIGLDLEAFLGGGRTDFDPAGVAGNPDSQPAWLVRMRINLSRDALAATFAAASGQAQAGLQLPFEAQIKNLDGQRGMVWITEFNNFYSRLAYLFPRAGKGNAWGADAHRSASMRSFQNLLAYARAQGIELRLFISPVHARYLEWYRHVGWWPLFEDWKRELVNALAEEVRSHPGQTPFALWDFSGFHPLATEPVPKLGDLATRMKWYLESSHYSPATGSLILERILGNSQADDSPLPNARIDRANIESHLSRLLMDAERFRVNQPAEVANVREMVAYLRRIARK